MTKLAASFRLSPEAAEGLERLCTILDLNQSQLVDWLIQKEMARRGFHLVEPERERIRMRIEIKTKNGQELPIYQHNGELFLPAVKDTEYAIRLINDCPNRRLAVLSVDGINAVSGKDADYKGQGYVLNPWESFDILGWWRSDREVAAFKFGAQEGSYAKKTGRSEKNIGVIGVAVFDENRPKVAWAGGANILRSHSFYSADEIPVVGNHDGQTMSWDRGATMDSMSMEEPIVSCNAAPEPQSGPIVSGHGYGATGQAARSRAKNMMEPSRKRVVGTQGLKPDMGTEYGQKTEMLTTTTSFERATEQPAEVIQVRYASIEVLKSWGVPVDQKPAERPNAFPAQAVGVPPPPGWNG